MSRSSSSGRSFHFASGCRRHTPRPLQGGLPFDPNPGPGDDKAGRSWMGPVVLGGAALVTTIGIAIGVARNRRSVAAS